MPLRFDKHVRPGNCSPGNPISDLGFERDKRIAMTFAEIKDVNDGFQGKEFLQISAAVFFKSRHSEHVGHVKEIQYRMDLLCKWQRKCPKTNRAAFNGYEGSQNLALSFCYLVMVSIHRDP